MCILSELFHVQAPSVGIGEAVTIQAWPTSVPALTFPSAVRTCSQSLWMLPLSFHSVRPPAWAAGARNTKRIEGPIALSREFGQRSSADTRTTLCIVLWLMTITSAACTRLLSGLAGTVSSLPCRL